MKAPVVNVAVPICVLMLVMAIAASGSRAQPLSERSGDAYGLCVGKGRTVLDKCLPARKVVLAQAEFEANVTDNTAASVDAGRGDNGIGDFLDLLDLMLDIPGPQHRVEILSFVGGGATWESVLALRDTLFDVPQKVSTSESDIEAAWTGRDDTTLVNIMELQISGEWFGWRPQRPGTERIFDR